MGWLAGMLTGYMNRHHAYEKQARDDAETRAKSEEAIYKTLLSHDDPKIQQMAATGILQLAQPRKRGPSGLSRFIGEMETSPVYAQLAQYFQTPQFTPAPPSASAAEQADAAPPTSTTAGRMVDSRTLEGEPTIPAPSSVPSPGGALPQTPGSAAQPAQAATQGGAVTPVQPPPQAAPPQPPPQLRLTPGAGPNDPETAEYADLSGQPPPAPPTAAPAGAPPAPPSGGMARTFAEATPTGTLRYPRFPGPDEAKLQSEMAGWEAIFERANPGDPENKQKAADAVLARYGHTGANPYQSVRGEYVDPTTGQVIQAYGVFNKSRGGYLVNGRPEASFRPIDTTSFGSVMNQAALEAGYNDANDVPTWDAARVQRIAQRLLFEQRQTGAEGTKMGQASGAIAPKDAADLNVAAGTQGRQLTGQMIPTPEQRTRRLTAETLKTQLEGIRPLLKSTLPSQNDLIGLAPNAANAVRQRMSGERRNQYAELNAKIDNIVAALSRSIGENRGAQTEADAQRAYNTIVDARGNLTDPLGGDTAESADARIAATLAYLDRILAMLPPPPMPTPLPAGAPQVGTPPPSPAMAQPGGITLDTPLPPGLRERIDPATGTFVQ